MQNYRLLIIIDNFGQYLMQHNFAALDGKRFLSIDIA